jgi:hypothetical protein
MSGRTEQDIENERLDAVVQRELTNRSAEALRDGLAGEAVLLKALGSCIIGSSFA